MNSSLVKSRLSRHGFTLVELMVAMALVSILAVMVTVALNSAQQDARLARTRSLVQRIDEILQYKMEEYKTRKLPVQLPLSSSTVEMTLLPVEVSRVRMMMMRDLMRMEMPDRRSDLIDASLSTPVRIGPTNIRAIVERTNSAGASLGAVATSVAWTTPSRYENYIKRLPANLADWSASYESSECLYLILSTTTLNGVSALDLISPANVTDLDEDNMPEIVDPFGNPISWVRWPAGAASSVVTQAGEDEFDLLNSDWGFRTAGDVSPSFSLRPLVVSAGLDGELGLVTTEYPTTPYGQMMWPDSTTDGRPRATSGGSYPYVDPFNRQAASEPLPGAVIPGQLDFIADNVVSYDL
ncbi:type II secretion system protein [Rosistilla oblonga]|uniref:type II secretion system protein n=1 Tax=Rosistilla oblonga TaxID=2527990 RepID=UPI003A98232B